MSHKGNFTTTQIASITLSLQDLINRQAAEIAGLKEERGKLQSRLNHVQSQLKDSAAKNGRLVEMHKWNLDFMEKQSEVNGELMQRLKAKEKQSVLSVFRLMAIFNNRK
jgi:predicted nuclease with TOPRIM domain